MARKTLLSGWAYRTYGTALAREVIAEKGLNITVEEEWEAAYVTGSEQEIEVLFAECLKRNKR